MRFWLSFGLLSLVAVLLSEAVPSLSLAAAASNPPTVQLDAKTVETRRQAEELIRRGLAKDDEGDPFGAFDDYQEALKLARQSGAAYLEARALHLSGDVAANLGELDRAFTFYKQAQKKWERTGAPADRMWTLQALARLNLQIGEPARAISLLHEARNISPDNAASLNILGMAFYRGESPGFALGMLSRALAQARLEGNPEREANVLGDTGSVALYLGDIEQASAAFEECLLISRKYKIPPMEAYGRAGRGRVLGLQGRFDEARAELDQAAAMFRRLGEPESLALVLAGTALVERQRGNLDEALKLSRESMDLIEAQRLEIAGPRARAAVLSALSDPYEIQIDVLWRLAQRASGRFEANAFNVSEKIRARTLYEGLVARDTSRRPGTASLERQRREVTLQLRNLEKEKLRLGEKLGGEDRSRGAQINGRIHDLLAREGALLEEIHQSDPSSALSGLQPLSLPQVQALLDPETALLVYTLGLDRSFVWWIERDSFSMREIADRATIEGSAKRALEQLARRGSKPGTKQHRQLNVSLTALSDLVLEPVLDKLPRVRRLAIVPDGLLQAVPFAALGVGEPLVASHVLVSLPSPSTLAALRRREAQRTTRPDKLIALITDPVFEWSDSRIARRPPGKLPPLGPPLPRLEQTGKEVDEILKLVPPGMGRRISGFDAVPEVMDDPDLRGYRYLHFGTHGLVDSKLPELSGIVLSRIAPDGSTPEDSLLSFYEVYNLDLPVDLVSLSTCGSAEGPRIRREGPITMARSFLYAGASRVLGTLWSVGDKPAAELTAAFYEGILRDGKTPSEALRDAQDAMRRNKWPTQEWAAFVLQGDWR
jgi:CHAT domain-containing protein/tetratricopeptide (TPR) repeat protein